MRSNMPTALVVVAAIIASVVLIVTDNVFGVLPVMILVGLFI